MHRIDLHAHVLTPRYEKTLSPGRRPTQTVTGLEEFMDRYNIDAAVVSMGGALESQDPTSARIGNEELAELVRDNPARFGAHAIVPFDSQDPEIAASEAVYALDTLGLDGVALFSNHHGTYLGDPLWEELFTELDRRGAYAFVHPATPPTGVALGEYPGLAVRISVRHHTSDHPSDLHRRVRAPSADPMAVRASRRNSDVPRSSSELADRA